jgi:hypothetical protein
MYGSGDSDTEPALLSAYSRKTTWDGGGLQTDRQLPQIPLAGNMTVGLTSMYIFFESGFGINISCQRNLRPLSACLTNFGIAYSKVRKKKIYKEVIQPSESSTFPAKGICGNCLPV